MKRARVFRYALVGVAAAVAAAFLLGMITTAIWGDSDAASAISLLAGVVAGSAICNGLTALYHARSAR